MYKISTAVFSQKGDRVTNGDYALLERINDNYYFAIADGIGSFPHGDIASSVACKTAVQCMQEYKINGSFDRVYNEITDKITNQKTRLHCKMGCSIGLMCIENNIIYRNHIGNCRIYYFKNRQLVERTKDQSVAQLNADAGEIHPDAIRFSKSRKYLTNAVGIIEQPKFICEENLSLESNQQILLCTDGFWELITENEMQLCLLNSDNAHDWISNMTKYFDNYSKSKRTDNMTAIAVYVK